MRDEVGWLVMFGAVLLALGVAVSCVGCAAELPLLTCEERCSHEAACEPERDTSWCRVRCEFWHEDFEASACALEASRLDRCIGDDPCGWRSGCAPQSVEYSECVREMCVTEPEHPLCGGRNE